MKENQFLIIFLLLHFNEINVLGLLYGIFLMRKIVNVIV